MFDEQMMPIEELVEAFTDDSVFVESAVGNLTYLGLLTYPAEEAYK